MCSTGSIHKVRNINGKNFAGQSYSKVRLGPLPLMNFRALEKRVIGKNNIKVKRTTDFKKCGVLTNYQPHYPGQVLHKLNMHVITSDIKERVIVQVF
jgi:hypothetical protein